VRPPHGPKQPGQQQNLSQTESINALLAIGGPACLWKTVEQQAGIRIDHFIELDLTGFVQVINAIGGVTACAPFAVNDPVSGLRLRAGRSHIMG
jgi:LCP family protein required for cell wall assembly